MWKRIHHKTTNTEWYLLKPPNYTNTTKMRFYPSKNQLQTINVMAFMGILLCFFFSFVTFPFFSLYLIFLLFSMSFSTFHIFDSTTAFNYQIAGIRCQCICVVDSLFIVMRWKAFAPFTSSIFLLQRSFQPRIFYNPRSTIHITL